MNPKKTNILHEKTATQEDLCRRCLQCCYRKAIIDGVTYQTPFPCPYLDIEGRRCAVYEKRFEINPSCVTAAEAAEKGYLPADCPYVGNRSGYIGSIPLPEAWMDELSLLSLAEALEVDPLIVEKTISELAAAGRLRESDDCGFDFQELS